MQELANLINVVLLDNHTLVRTGLRLIIENQPGIKVVGEADNLENGLEVISATRPDIILLELDSDCNLGLEAIPQLLNRRKQAKIILVTNHTDPLIISRALQNGVLGVVFLHQDPEIMVKAIHKVYAGEAWVDRVMIASLITSMSSRQPASESNPEEILICQLSQSEKNVIQLIGKGMKNQQIATQLSISEITVRHHLTSIYSKLGVTNRLELLVFAHRCGLINKKI